MIVENYPELARLDAQQKLILAGELWKSVAVSDNGTPELSAEVIGLLEERLKHFEENPDSGVRWEELRDRVARG